MEGDIHLRSSYCSYHLSIYIYLFIYLLIDLSFYLSHLSTYLPICHLYLSFIVIYLFIYGRRYQSIWSANKDDPVEREKRLMQDIEVVIVDEMSLERSEGLYLCAVGASVLMKKHGHLECCQLRREIERMWSWQFCGWKVKGFCLKASIFFGDV